MGRTTRFRQVALAASSCLGLLAIGSFRPAVPLQGPDWVTLYEEGFDSLQVDALSWTPDTYPNDDPYSDNGQFFKRLHVTPPRAFRASATFGRDKWLTVETYSRSPNTRFEDLFSVTPDPESPSNRVLRIQSLFHTDATIIRPTRPLPRRYRICLRIGYAQFGDGKPGRANTNGYLGGERSEPWFDEDATEENGFYWLAILDAVPRPHNNIWIQHHRKVAIDSDNNKAAWTLIWNGTQFVASGEHPVMMFAIDAHGSDDDRVGPPFIAYAAGRWQAPGSIRAVDAYRDNTWYHACVERGDGKYSLGVSGDFRFGGKRTYSADIDSGRVYHAQGWPDYFVFGDPHNNYYRGRVYYDDIHLEVPKE